MIAAKVSDVGVSGKTNESGLSLLISYFMHWRMLPMTIEFCRSLEANVLNREGGYNWLLCSQTVNGHIKADVYLPDLGANLSYRRIALMTDKAATFVDMGLLCLVEAAIIRHSSDNGRP
jgi:hypothetical protein